MIPFALLAVMYHYVRDPGDAAEGGSGIPGLPRAAFLGQIDELARRYEMVAWPAVRACLAGGRPLPARACLLTFDDGVKDHYYNVFPALRARGLSGLFFALARQPGDVLALGHQIHFALARWSVEALRETVRARLTPARQAALDEAEARYRAAGERETGAFKTALQRELAEEARPILEALLEEHIGPAAALADRHYLSPNEIGEMAEGGMHFGGHSRAHPWLDWVSPARQQAEIAASAAWLREVEEGPWAFAYPYGGIGRETPGLLRAGGFAAGFTTAPAQHHTDAFLIGRVDGEEGLPAPVLSGRQAV